MKPAARAPIADDPAFGPPLDHLLSAIRNVVSDTAVADLSLRQIGVLILLDREQLDDRRVKVLALSLNVAKPTISRALDRLEAELLATRLPGIHDRRDMHAAITPRGREWLASFATWHIEAKRQRAA